MRIAPISCNQNFGARDALKGIIYARPLANGKTQEGIINQAVSELETVKFNKQDIEYMHSIGVNPPFENGKEAVVYLKKHNIPIQYGVLSDNVHACLANGDKPHEKIVLINAKYKNYVSKPEILATAEAIAHEAAHAKDEDKQNSIQEELDNLSVNVLLHRAFERKFPGIFENCNGFLFREGVTLYPRLFFDCDVSKSALKERVADKYGHMQPGDEKHPASSLAQEIKALDICA